MRVAMGSAVRERRNCRDEQENAHRSEKEPKEERSLAFCGGC
jgi:hypothetical protein